MTDIKRGELQVKLKSYGQNSFQDNEYKGYIIRLKFGTLTGGWYMIYKVVNGKWYNLRQRGWNFIIPDLCLQKAVEYIDNFENKLEEKLQSKL